MQSTDRARAHSSSTDLFARSGALFAATIAALAVSPPFASACENGVELRVDPRAAAVHAAEQLVQEGHPEAAYRKIVAADPQFPKRKVGAEPLSDRALVVLARAAVRSHGAALRDPAHGEATDKEREENLSWADRVLKELHRRRPDDPVLTTDLGEAMAHRPAERKDGLALLERLEVKDLVASPYGYLALADARDRLGDGRRPFIRGPLRALGNVRQDIERSRCREMAKEPAICGG